jgi:uncharacterized membrane protein YqaE (UPF0057 family)
MIVVINAKYSMTIIKIIAALVLPPLAAFMEVGLGMHFWLNIVLTLFGYFPGLLHALWLIARDQN